MPLKEEIEFRGTRFIYIYLLVLETGEHKDIFRDHYFPWWGWGSGGIEGRGDPRGHRQAQGAVV